VVYCTGLENRRSARIRGFESHSLRIAFIIKHLRRLLANWERFIHETRDVDPLIRMAVAHYQFEAIHPFADGNGRTGRVLTPFS
jgi:Fic family protein